MKKSSAWLTILVSLLVAAACSADGDDIFGPSFAVVGGAGGYCEPEPQLATRPLDGLTTMTECCSPDPSRAGLIVSIRLGCEEEPEPVIECPHLNTDGNGVVTGQNCTYTYLSAGAALQGWVGQAIEAVQPDASINPHCGAVKEVMHDWAAAGVIYEFEEGPALTPTGWEWTAGITTEDPVTAPPPPPAPATEVVGINTLYHDDGDLAGRTWTLTHEAAHKVLGWGALESEVDELVRMCLLL